ncbi:MAG: hypothetical protein R2827_00140 [Bdellovibrionales bacterium]
MEFVKNFIVSMGLFLALDWVWFNVFMKSFAENELRPLLRMNEDGSLDVNLFFAISAYIVMCVFLIVFSFT